MRVVKAGTKGGSHDDVSACRGLGDFGISVFHRPGWSYRPQASALNRAREGSVEPTRTALPSAGIVF